MQAKTQQDGKRKISSAYFSIALFIVANYEKMAAKKSMISLHSIIRTKYALFIVANYEKMVAEKNYIYQTQPK